MTDTEAALQVLRVLRKHADQDQEAHPKHKDYFQGKSHAFTHAIDLLRDLAKSKKESAETEGKKQAVIQQ